MDFHTEERRSPARLAWIVGLGCALVVSAAFVAWLVSRRCRLREAELAPAVEAFLQSVRSGSNVWVVDYADDPAVRLHGANGLPSTLFTAEDCEVIEVRREALVSCYWV